MNNWRDFELIIPDPTAVALYQSVNDCKEFFVPAAVSAIDDFLAKNITPASAIAEMFATIYNRMNNQELCIALLAALVRVAELQEPEKDTDGRHTGE